MKPTLSEEQLKHLAFQAIFETALNPKLDSGFKVTCPECQALLVAEVTRLKAADALAAKTTARSHLKLVKIAKKRK